ncbi:MAG: S8 family serine peptidase [Candidatus Sedimenticola sp. 6PFRAG7]
MNHLIRIMMAVTGFIVLTGAVAEGIGTHRGKPSLVPDEIIVTYDIAATSGRKANIRHAYGLTKKRDSNKAGAFVVYKHRNPKAVLNMLKHEPGVVSVEQNAYAFAYMSPNDPYYFPYQWNMERIGMESAWDYNAGAGVTVAVIDTGVRESLLDLAGTLFTAGYDFVNSDLDPNDDKGHGSHVAGTVAQTTNNSLGVTGIAYNATLMPVKVLNKRGTGTIDDIADGVYFATDNGADIINMSLGGPSYTETLENAVNYAWNHGVVVICAAGNESSSEPAYPAAYENAVSVSATTYGDSLASYSNYGDTIDIAAPGGDTGDNNGDGYDDMILQNTFLRRNEGYYFYAGTSMASPHVAAVAALVKSANPELSNIEIRGILESTAEDLGATGWDQSFGYGLVDAYAAVQAAGGSGGGGDTTPPVLSNLAETVTINAAIITWTTNEAADSVVNYGLDANYGDSVFDTLPVTLHTLELTGLTANTEYHYQVTSTDGAGNSVQSADRVFYTLPAGEDSYMHVSDISLMTSSRGVNTLAHAAVTMMDDSGNPVEGATVYGSWSGAVSGSVAGTTGADGSVVLSSPKTKSGVNFTFTVNDVQHGALTYDAEQNVETSDSI